MLVFLGQCHFEGECGQIKMKYLSLERFGDAPYLLLSSALVPRFDVLQAAQLSCLSNSCCQHCEPFWVLFSLQTRVSCAFISQEGLPCCRVSTGCHGCACSSWPRTRRCLQNAWPLPTACARRHKGCSCTTCTWTACPPRGWTPSMRKACRGWGVWLCRLPSWRMRRGKASCACLGALPSVHKRCGTL